MTRLAGVASRLSLSVLIVAACQSGGSGLPEPVSEREAARQQPVATGLPPGHPAPTAPDGATDRPLPAGTRNPMEDIIAFKARLEKNPKDLEALISLGNANMMISRLAAAQDMYARALAINPKDLDVRTNLAIAYKYGGRPEEAFTELQKNLEMDPRHDPSLYNLGFLYYYDKKDLRKAREIWSRWIELYPNAPAAADVTKQLAQIEVELTSAR